MKSFRHKDLVLNSFTDLLGFITLIFRQSIESINEVEEINCYNETKLSDFFNDSNLFLTFVSRISGSETK